MKLKLLSLLGLFLFMALVFNQPVQAQPFTNDMINVSPLQISTPFKTNFTVTVTNLRNDSVWIFCLASANITRTDAPVFKTLLSNATYDYKFVSPDINETLMNETSQVYSIFFGAVDQQATSFQTVEVDITVTTVAWINQQLQQLLLQNTQLLLKVQEMTDKASNNNILVLGIVLSNAIWIAVIMALRLYKKKPLLAVEKAPP